jgi:hypothetical protein
MSTYKTDLKNINKAFEDHNLVKALDIWMQSYSNISVEKFVECAMEHDYAFPSEIIADIDDIQDILSMTRQVILNHYNI